MIVIIVVLLLAAYKLLLDYLDYRNLNAPVPDNVKDIYDAETYSKRNKYEVESTKLALIELR